MRDDMSVTDQLDASTSSSLDVSTADMLSLSPDADVPSDQGLQNVDAISDPPPIWEPTLPESVELSMCGQAQELRATVVSEGATDERGQTLRARARIFEKIFHAFHTYATGINVELGVVSEEARTRIEEFATDDSVWTLDDAGLSYEDLASGVTKAAGLYGGVGVAADAFRYMVLIEEGAPCEDIEYARQALYKDLEALHVATAITGVKGVIARALGNTLISGAGQAETFPLFDEMGRAFPLEKTNGTWRDDQSGEYPTMVWEDSCSRDMYVGWALAYASVWEAIRTDPTFSDQLKLRLRTDAHDLVHSLMQVGEQGYDLEIRDADGRMTYHGILNENSVDRSYFPGAPNGFNGILTTGIVAALAWVSGDPVQLEFVEEALIDTRGLLDLAKTSLLGIDRGPGSNFSAYNMAFTGAWLAARYLRREVDRTEVREVLRRSLYQREGQERQPVEQSQALYHLIFVQSELGIHTFGRDTVTPSPLFEDALESTRRDLFDFPAPPFFGRNIVNCDEQEIETNTCVAENGLELPLLGNVGWNDDLVAAIPVPLTIRPVSNYYWRSNPYTVNGGTSRLTLLPASDFRWVYWAGRSLTMSP
jgi:hypothetical protein